MVKTMNLSDKAGHLTRGTRLNFAMTQHPCSHLLKYERQGWSPDQRDEIKLWND